MGEQSGKNRQAGHAQRYQTVFDFSAGQKSGRQTARADADEQPALQIAAVPVVKMKNVLAVKNHGQLQQHRQKGKKRVADDAEKQNAVAADGLELRPEIAEKIRAEFFVRVRGGQPPDAEAKGQADHRQRDEDDAGPDLPFCRMCPRGSPARIVPVMAAEKVPRPKMPLPQDNFFSGNSSGNMPYFVGPKIALCVLIRKMPVSISGILTSHRPSVTTDMMPSSAHLTAMATLRLLKRSAKKPPAIENRHERQREHVADQRHEAVALLQRETHADDHER